MKILILTQKVDLNDPILGFFHGWITEFAKSFQQITVICLQKGEYNLPSNVKVFSLGKEKKRSRLIYVYNFYKFIWRERNNYDRVFVHMNQEYVLLGALFWKFLGKRIFMWRNHLKGSFLTRLAVMFSESVFCTSTYSYTAKFKKTRLMPVGVDLKIFKRLPEVVRIQNSILFIGRISPVKNVDTLIDALIILDERGQDFVSHIYGEPGPTDVKYFEGLQYKARNLIKSGKLIFNGAIANNKTPEIYNAHEIFVNLTDSGSFDKTIVEAVLCGNIAVASNRSLKNFLGENYIFEDKDPKNLAEKLIYVIGLSVEEKLTKTTEISMHAANHGLDKLVVDLVLKMR